MKALFWIVFVSWLGTAIVRTMYFGLAGYTSPIQLRAYWGTRYFVPHLALETAVVIASGYLVHARPEAWRGRATTAGLVGVVGLVLLHIGSMYWKIGYRERVTLAGQRHVVDWVYSPTISHPGILAIQVSYPGYRPLYRDKTWSDLRLTLTKSNTPGSYKVAFDDPPRQDNPECLVGTHNRYCRFFKDGAWYAMHHQTRNQQAPAAGPALQDLQNDLPELFGTFVKDR